MSLRLKFIVLATVAMVAAMASACGNDGGASTEDHARLQQMEQQINDIHDSMAHQQVLVAYTALRAEGLHGLSEDLQKASEIDPNWHGAVSRMHLIITATEWPEELQPLAGVAATQLDEFAAALNAGDLAASKTQGPEAHLAWHNLDGAAANFLGANSHDDMSH